MARGRRGGPRRGAAAAALAAGLAALAAAALLGGAAAQCGAGCDGCKKRRCKKDGVCFWSGSSCADATDFCAAVQGKKKRRKKCQATISAPAVLGSPNCVCSRAKKKCGKCKVPGGDIVGDGAPTGAAFPDRAALWAAVDSCLRADSSGVNCKHNGIPISDWDVSRVTDMNELFRGAAEFNADISKWNTAAVTRMEGMFWDASAFNQDLSSWDVMAVTDNEIMWYGATAMTDEAHKPCTATGVGADGTTPWRKC